MAYRMKMFKSQKPSSVDLRVSDFKRVPGFNYVLSVSAEDEHTYNSLCSDIREAWAIRPTPGGPAESPYGSSVAGAGSSLFEN